MALPLQEGVDKQVEAANQSCLRILLFRYVQVFLNSIKLNCSNIELHPAYYR